MDFNNEERKRTRTNMENLSSNTIRLSRDLLQRFVSCGSRQDESKAVRREEEGEDEEGDVELSLGLSLGGRFGVDKSSKKLRRSTSIAACLPILRDDDAVAPPATGYHTLVRTSSLPVETEEEWRKRKELQTLRRMEAKRRRSQKQRISRGEKEGSGGGGLEEERREIEVNWRERLELLATKRVGSSVLSPVELTAARQASLDRRIDLAITRGKANYVGGTGGGGLGKLLSQGSIESQGGSSSSMSELESKALQGSSSGNLSPVSNAGSSGTKAREYGSRTPESDVQSPCKRADLCKNQGNQSGINAMEDMPCVFTVGDGPNGRRVDGILYKYGKGEEVRIMCVCHGSFLSPAEFIKHAGGNNVAHPLKHIVINPNPPSFQ